MMYISYSIVLSVVLQIHLPKAQSKQLAYFDEPKFWLQARDTCARCGGELVNLDKNVIETVINSDLHNKTVWIGNYTRQYPWIREIGCALKPAAYKVIYHNTPEFCSRTCNNGQRFAIEDDKCYCIDNKISTVVPLCGDNSNVICHPSCSDDYVTVLTIDNVYTCDFEEDFCTNTSFGEKQRGLVWTRTNDDGGIGSIGKEKGYFLLLQSVTDTAENKALLSIHLSLERIYYCLSFKYYIYNGGAIEIYVTKETGARYIAWRKYGKKGHMWYSSSIDIEGHRNLIIDIYGSVESYNVGKMAIDDIKLQPLACNKETSLDCSFDDSSCEWEYFLDSTLEKNIGSTDKGNIDDYAVQNKAKTGTAFLVSSNIHWHRSTELCLQFKYFSTNAHYGFSKIEAYVNNTVIVSIAKLRRNEWVKSAITFQNRNGFTIKFEITTADEHVRIDDITVRSGSCNQDVLLVCDFSKDMCGLTVEEERNFRIGYFNSRNALIIGTTRDKIYLIKTPLINVTATTMFCFTFYYLLYTYEPAAVLRIAKVINNTNTSIWNSKYVNVYTWHGVSLDIEANEKFSILIEVYRSHWDINIANLVLKAGICEKGAYGNLNTRPKGPMCSMVDFSDNSRLSVGHCSKMDKQPYICEFEDGLNHSTGCQPVSILHRNATSATTTANITTTHTRKPYTKEPSCEDRSISSWTTSNSSATLSVWEQLKNKIELVVVSSSLSAVVVILLVFVVLLIRKIKRNQDNGKENSNLDKDCIENHDYELADVNATYILNERTNSSVNPRQKQRSVNDICNNGAVQNRPESAVESRPEGAYQNCNSLTLQQSRDSQIYQDMEEGAYDHLGKSAERRKNYNSESDNLYDHGQTVKSQNNDMYDLTDDKYFILEPEDGASNESVFYDQVK